MKVTMTCPQCRKEELQDFTTTKLYTVQVADDGTYDLKCDKGHVTTYFGQSVKFELLFEIAMNAVVDGYYREAVASAASSLERFLEFASRCLLRSLNVDVKVFEEAWSRVNSQSERQLGLFIAAYISCFQEMPILLVENGRNKASVEFRNAVIHKGRIPTGAEAIAFVDAVYSIIGCVVTKMRLAIPSALLEVTLEETKKVGSGRSEPRSRLIGDDLTFSTILMTTYPYPAQEGKPHFMLTGTVRERLADIEAQRVRIANLQQERVYQQELHRVHESLEETRKTMSP